MNMFLAAAALLFAVNPARRSLELAPRPARRVAAVAAAGVVVAIIALAVVSGPLLDLLDVSPPTFRVAAGLVLGFRGLLDLVRAPTPEPEGLSGWGEALFPVGLPVLFRPEVAVLALAAGADLGVARVGILSLVPIGLAAFAAVRWRHEPSARAVAMMLSAGAILVAVALITDGVLDI
jgi:small neutral amino acid transporter SnatA (MarC family)